MTARPTAVLIATALVLGALLLAGCASSKPQAGTNSVVPSGADTTVTTVATASPVSATGTVDAGSGSSGSKASGGQGSNITGADLAAIKKQLDAMQKELESMSMPTDNDFSGAEGAIY